MGRRVVEAPALEVLGSVRRQAAIVGADGEDDEPGAHLLTVGEHQLPQPIRSDTEKRQPP